MRHQVVSCTGLILLASVKVVNLGLQNLILTIIECLTISIPLNFTFVSLLAQVSMCIHLLIVLLLTSSLVGHREVLIKSVALCR